MSRTSKIWMLVISLLVHIIFFVSIIDIYLKSPLTTGVEPVINDHLPAPAKRLILFVGDGLRADLFFELLANERNSSYLRYVIEKRGRWGISHTIAPTESRPGHVALTAGFYEDPSAIFKGWKANPVEYDTVFNRSTMTFGWGSPDILPMFDKESSKGRIIMKMYSRDYQRYCGTTGRETLLNSWTVVNFERFLQDAKSSSTLLRTLNQDKIIFFFHLIGTDLAGAEKHEAYVDNIRVADEVAKKTEKLINEFYNYDNKSVFIFTSDHGMTDLGSHGGGSAKETEMPFVVWGSGIRKPSVVRDLRSPVNWDVNHLERNDIGQIDTAPLMSILLGLPIPVNSVGTFPDTVLSGSMADKSAAWLLNARQMLAQFDRKRKMVEDAALRFLYQPFEELSDRQDSLILRRLELQLANGHYDWVIEGSKKLVSLCLAGLSYYHNYYQRLLLFCISFSYVGWICWLLLTIASNDASMITKYNEYWTKRRSRLSVLNCAFLVLILITYLLLTVQNLPYQYHLYCYLPSIIWWNVLRKLIVSRYKSVSYSWLFIFCVTIVGTELVVISFFDRRALSVIMFFLLFWPISCVRKTTSMTIFFALWILSCISLMVFPFLPVMGGKPNNFFVILGTVVWWILIACSRKFISRMHPAYIHFKAVRYFDGFSILFCVALINILYVTITFSLDGPSFVSQHISWLMLSTSLLLPLVSSRKFILRLLNVYFAFGIISLLLSVNHDALFLPLFSFHLFLWFLAENIIVSDQSKHSVLDISCTKFSRGIVPKMGGLNLSNLRLAFLCFIYVAFSFFGISNIATINSYDKRWVRCFISASARDKIMVLIFLKIVVPFIVTICTFRAVIDLMKTSADKIFVLVLIYCDIMGLNFIFLVRNVGSWLEIGSTVTNFIVSQTLILFIILLYVLCIFFTGFKFKKPRCVLLKLSNLFTKRTESSV